MHSPHPRSANPWSKSSVILLAAALVTAACSVGSSNDATIDDPHGCRTWREGPADIVPAGAQEYHVVLGQQFQWVETGTEPVRAVTNPGTQDVILKRVSVRTAQGHVYSEFQARRLGSAALVVGLGDNSQQRVVIDVEC